MKYIRIAELTLKENDSIIIDFKIDHLILLDDLINVTSLNQMDIDNIFRKNMKSMLPSAPS